MSTGVAVVFCKVMDCKNAEGVGSSLLLLKQVKWIKMNKKGLNLLKNVIINKIG